MSQDNKGQPQQGGQSSNPGQQTQQPGQPQQGGHSSNPGQQTQQPGQQAQQPNEKPGKDAGKS